jgi:hypothetical protein
VTKEFCSEITSLTERRYRKEQQKVGEELLLAISALKVAEIHLLKVHIAMENMQGDEIKIADVRRWAHACEEAAEGSTNYLQLIGVLLGHEGVFSADAPD